MPLVDPLGHAYPATQTPGQLPLTSRPVVANVPPGHNEPSSTAVKTDDRSKIFDVKRTVKLPEARNSKVNTQYLELAHF